MNNFPIPTHRQADARRASSYISIDIYILLAISSVMALTAIAQLISHLSQYAWLLSIVTILFIISTVLCAAISVWRASAAQWTIDRRSVSMSAALGSFFSGLFTVVFADDTVEHAMIIIWGIVLAIVAMCIIWIIFILMKDDQDNEPATRIAPPGVTDTYRHEIQRQDAVSVSSSVAPVQAQDPARGTFSSSPPLYIPPPGSQNKLNIIPSETSGLPSLFERDELYAVPLDTRARIFIVTKSNDISENCEDACAISDDETRFALCDGVSASKFARPWARLLALQWVKQPLAAFDAETLEIWLEEPRELWLKWVNETWLSKINERNRSLGRIEFSQSDMKKFITQGAATTFLGVTFDRVRSTWSAIAVGDTCFFHFFHTDTGMWNYTGFPLKQSSEFTDGPASITTRPLNVPLVASHLVSTNGKYKAGDILVMATDALAMWFFIQLEHEQIKHIIITLDQLERGKDEMFAEWVNQQRAKKQLTDDDTTLIIIHPT
jgi:hypothetical protein